MNIYNMYICFGGFRKKQQQSTTVWSMKHPYSFFVQHVHNNAMRTAGNTWATPTSWHEIQESISLRRMEWIH